jgi:hypothetical protein
VFIIDEEKLTKSALAAGEVIQNILLSRPVRGKVRRNDETATEATMACLFGYHEDDSDFVLDEERLPEAIAEAEAVSISLGMYHQDKMIREASRVAVLVYHGASTKVTPDKRS